MTVAASDVNFEPQTSLEEYSEQSRSPKASKMDLQMSIGCLIFPKKSKMRFDCYLLYLRQFLTSKSDFKIDQKSFKNEPGYKHRNLSWIFNIFSHQNENSSRNGPKRVPKQGVEKVCNFGLDAPLASRLISGAGNGSTRLVWTPK